MKITWAELRRRKVIRVAVAYLVGAWLLIQVADTLFGMLEVPGWAGKALLAALAIGFPLALILAWAFDITPDGIIATDEASDDDSEKKTPAQSFEFSELGTIELDQLDLGRPQLTALYGRDEECAAIASGGRAQARELAAVAGRAYRELGMARHVGLTEKVTVNSLTHM